MTLNFRQIISHAIDLMGKVQMGLGFLFLVLSLFGDPKELKFYIAVMVMMGVGYRMYALKGQYPRNEDLVMALFTFLSAMAWGAFYYIMPERALIVGVLYAIIPIALIIRKIQKMDS